MTFFAMPMTCHQSLERQAAGIRELIEADYNAIRVPVLKRLRADYTERSEPTSDISGETATFNVQKAFGPAPFVGDPRYEEAVYVWKAAIDRAGRWVAGEARLHWKRL